MAIIAPTSEQLKHIASEMGLSLSESDIASFIALMRPSIDAYNVLDQLPDNLPPVKYPRASSYRPSADENRYNASYHKHGSRVHRKEGSKIRQSCSRIM